MTSKNHQFPEYADTIYTRYKKTTVGAVACQRLNPNDEKQHLSVYLQSDFDKFNEETKHLIFNYDTDVLELYSEREDKYFKSVNTYLFSEGIIVPYYGEKPIQSTSNALSDEQVAEIASVSNHLQFRKALKDVTSVHTLNRIKESLPKSKSKLFYEYAEERLKELETV